MPSNCGKCFSASPFHCRNNVITKEFSFHVVMVKSERVPSCTSKSSRLHAQGCHWGLVMSLATGKPPRRTNLASYSLQAPFTANVFFPYIFFPAIQNCAKM